MRLYNNNRRRHKRAAQLSRSAFARALQCARRHVREARSLSKGRRRRGSSRKRSMRGGGRRATHRIKAGQHCAPGQSSSYTCFDKEHLRVLAREWNRSCADAGGATKGASERIRDPERQTKRQLWQALNARLRSDCDSEYCWTKHPRLRAKGGTVARTSFRPSKPSSWTAKPNEWLSNIDILRVLEQYEAIYDDFRMIGPVPIDFEKTFSDAPRDCVSPELCQMDLRAWWREGVRRVGIVFNLDPHDQDGSHWVALFVDLQKGDVLYYDSYGLRASDEVRTLMDSFVRQGNQLPNRRSTEPFRIRWNNTRHQFRNSECGVYGMHFITQMLEGVDYEWYMNHGMNDRQMQTFRNVFYNPMRGHVRRTAKRGSYKGATTDPSEEGGTG